MLDNMEGPSQDAEQEEDEEIDDEEIVKGADEEMEKEDGDGDK